MAARDGTDAALLVIDLQRDFCHPNGVFFCHPNGVFARAGLRAPGIEDVVTKVNRLARAARDAGCPVVWMRMVWHRDEDVGLLAQRSPFLRDEGLRAGTWGAELLDGLAVEPGDWRLEKRRFSAFYGNDLADLLAAHGIERVVVAGVRTDFCVESTVRDAFFRDLDVSVLRDAVQGFRPELHEASLREMGTVFAHVVDTDEAIGVLAGHPRPCLSERQVTGG